MKFTELEEESRPQLVNRLLLNIRLKKKEAFENAMQSGFLYFGEKELYNIMTSDLLKQICDCNELDTFLGWGDKLYDDGFNNWKDRINNV